MIFFKSRKIKELETSLRNLQNEVRYQKQLQEALLKKLKMHVEYVYQESGPVLKSGKKPEKNWEGEE